MGNRNHIIKLIGYQTLFWVSLFLFGLVQNYRYDSELGLSRVIIYDFCHLIFQIAGANVIFYLLVIPFFEKKRYIVFTANLAVILYLLGVVNRIFIVRIAEPIFVNEPKDSFLDIFTDLAYLWGHYVLPILTASFIFVCYMHILRYRNEKQDRITLQKEKAELELKVLKSHLNPHFLFNTLNNIYSLAVNHPEKTQKSISGLSDILDYVIYKGSLKTICITEEMDIVNRYIELEELRYEKLVVKKNISKQFENKIPPLIYLSLVENAFKHGTVIDDTMSIDLELGTDAKQSVFFVRNSNVGKKIGNREGTGLTNIREQLYLYYGNNFELTLDNGENWFSVKIVIPVQND